jgi:5-methylcytosine-specific restriction enzyme A
MPQRPGRHQVLWHKPREQAERERKARLDAERPGTAQRGYDQAWRALRARYLEANPDCETPGCRRPATDVDHRQSVRDRPDLRLDWFNLRALCHPCHSRRTARDQGFARPRA